MSNGNGETRVLRPAGATPRYGLRYVGDAQPADAHELSLNLAQDTESALGNLDDLLANARQALESLLAARWAPGDLKTSAAASAGEGWLLCDGTAYPRSQYPELFQAIGTVYGAGDGTSTFNVPDLRNKMPLGASAQRPRGWSGGDETVTLSATQCGVNPNGSTGYNTTAHYHHLAGQASGYDTPDHSHTTARALTSGATASHTHGFYDGTYWSVVSQGGWSMINVTSVGSGGQSGVPWTPAMAGTIATTTYESADHQHYTEPGATTGASARHQHSVPAQWSETEDAPHGHLLNARDADTPHPNMPPHLAVNIFIKT